MLPHHCAGKCLWEYSECEAKRSAPALRTLLFLCLQTLSDGAPAEVNLTKVLTTDQKGFSCARRQIVQEDIVSVRQAIQA
jgi:hypothetical protein